MEGCMGTSGVMLLWMIPIPPALAIATAILGPVTVLMAALTMPPDLIRILRLTKLLHWTWFG